MEKEKSLVEVKTTSEDKTQNIDLLSLLGIKIEDNKIEIDTNATKSFFEQLQEKVQKSVQEIEEGIEKGKIDLKESVGLKVEESKIEIDLEKAKSFLDEVTNKVQDLVINLDKTLNNITKNK